MFKRIITMLLIGLFTIVPVLGGVGIQEVRAEDSIDVPVTVVWHDDDDDSLRPSVVGFKFVNDSSVTSSEICILTKDNDYSTVFKMPLDSEGNYVDYSLSVVYSPRYSTVVTGNVREGFVIDATYKTRQTTTVKLTKDLKGTSEEEEFGIYSFTSSS